VFGRSSAIIAGSNVGAFEDERRMDPVCRHDGASAFRRVITVTGIVIALGLAAASFVTRVVPGSGVLTGRIQSPPAAGAGIPNGTGGGFAVSIAVSLSESSLIHQQAPVVPRPEIFVESGSRVVIASLDRNARLHHVRLEWTPVGAATSTDPRREVHAGADIARVTRSEFRLITFEPRCTQSSCLKNAEVRNGPTSVTRGELGLKAALADELRHSNPAVLSESDTTRPICGDRTFRVPYFMTRDPDHRDREDSPHVSDRITRCRLLLESDTLRIYTAHSLVSRPASRPAGGTLASSETHGLTVPVYAGNGKSICRDPMLIAAEKIVVALESNVCPLIRSTIGEVADVDRDGRTAVVLCDLADRQPVGNPPILGCVRAGDFLDEHNLAGDIIYLDQSLTDSACFTAVLAHEFAHAAVFSILRVEGETCHGQGRLPVWLNEAIAHSCEFELVPDSRNLSTRIARFLEAPHTWPLLVPYRSQSGVTTRGPVRAAGLFFVQFLQRRGVEPDAIVRTPGTGPQRIEALTQLSFDEVFRQWTLDLLMQSETGRLPLTVSPLPENRATNGLWIRGTAAAWFRSATAGRLSVLAEEDCELQVTVVSD